MITALRWMLCVTGIALAYWHHAAWLALCVPIWVVDFGRFVGITRALREWRHPRNRLDALRCPECGYQLNERILKGCPECGWQHSTESTSESIRGK